jgi:hypothetical protein
MNQRQTDWEKKHKKILDYIADFSLLFVESAPKSQGQGQREREKNGKENAVFGKFGTQVGGYIWL